MKKFLSLILAVVLALSATLALAEAPAEDKNCVFIKFNVDNEATKTVMAQLFGMPEEQIKGVEPFLPLLGALGLRVTRGGEAGTEFDIVLGDKDAVSITAKQVEKEFQLVSSLFPNYVLTVDEETLKTVSPGNDPEAKAAASEAMAGYVQKYVQSVTGAMKPGETEKGTYEFGGLTFDTHMPMTMDNATMCDAVKTFMKEALSDERVTAPFKTIPGFNPEEMLEQIDKMSAENFPEVTVDVYLSEANSEQFYVESKSTFTGEQKGVNVDFTMLAKSSKEGTVNVSIPEQKITVDVEYAENRIYVEFAKDEKWMGVDALKAGDDQFLIDLYAVTKDKPFAGLDIITASADVVLPVETEGKTVVSLKDLQGEKSSEVMGGLMGDVMSNGLGALMQAVNEVAPDAAAMFGQMMAPQQ